MKAKITYLGGATYLIEIGSFRLLTDPGFDPEGTEKSEGPGHVLKKVMSPPIPAEEIGELDAVLLSHQQRYDNLDVSGRALLPKVPKVITTKESSDFLGDNAQGIDTWETVKLRKPGGEAIRVTGTPAAHGLAPEVRAATGETMGFVIEWEGQPGGALYISGDTVYIDDLEEIGKRFDIGAAILHMGAAKIPAAGDNALTMTTAEGIKLAQSLDAKDIFPAHFEGWLHYTEGRDTIEAAFAA